MKDELTKEQKTMLQETFFASFVEEWDFEKNDKEFPNITILTIAPRSSLKLWWKCKEFGHQWQSNMRHRSDGSSCPVCANRKLLTGFNDFATKNPELVNAWKTVETNPDPSTVLFGTSTIKVDFPCTEGHLYKITPAALSRGRRCGYCSGTQILPGFNDLVSKCPDSLEWWDYEKNKETPYEVRYGSDVKKWWKCVKFGHSYFASINHFRQGRRCPICARKTIDNTTSLNATHPHLIKEWITEKNKRKIEETSAGHDGKMWWRCSKCSHEWQAYVYNRTHKKRPQGCPKCAKGVTSSRGEKQIYEFLINNGLPPEDIVQHKRMKNEMTQRMFELDLYIPEKNIAIEFNGVYYHSEKFVEKDYHYNKYRACKQRNIQLLQIWEDDWNVSETIVQKTLLDKLGLNASDETIYADDTQIKEVNVKDAAIFLNNHHLQGAVKTSRYIGLHTGDRLISLIAVKEEDNSRTFNIVRYATSENVIRGFEKLLSHIEKEYDFDRFVAFSDNCIGDEQLYSSNGFKQVGEVKPDYTYLIKKQFRENKAKYNRKKFKNDPTLMYEETMTVKQLTKLNNMLRVYDAGRIKWVKELNPRPLN